MNSVRKSATAYEGRQQRIAIVRTSASCVCKTLAKVEYAVRTIVHDSYTLVIGYLHVHPDGYKTAIGK